ncbi:hypothetical protein B296_00012433 [Ensete ventricosum]|uniref:Protein IDA-LIKE 2 n=1 Tax=Ensete ventricosum TaxID=4639 RepID=A0A427ALR2_ENSVE|nr:hypothetical protein B296_00012433 [Ensete ventricosum]
MSDPCRRSVLVVWLLLLLLLLLRFSCCCHGAREMQVFKKKPSAERRNSGYFTGFLPKATPVPPSAPSKHHNSIGLDRTTTAP